MNEIPETYRDVVLTKVNDDLAWGFASRRLDTKTGLYQFSGAVLFRGRDGELIDCYESVVDDPSPNVETYRIHSYIQRIFRLLWDEEYRNEIEQKADEIKKASQELDT